MIHQVRDEAGTLLIEQNDDTRTYSDFREDPPLIRPYTEQENIEATARLAQERANANQLQIEQLLDTSLATLQTIIDDTNQNINANAANRIKELARVQRRLIRHVISKFDATS